MTARFVALATLPLLLATPAFADQISCEGVFAAKSTLADFEEAYGKANVVTGEVDGPEGTTMVATTVFPNDEDKTFEVYWFDEVKHERLAGFTVPAKDTAPGGVKLGMSIKDVQKLNGKVFTLWGFYWDYGGQAGFKDGKLANLPGGCYINVTFNPSIDPPNDKISNAVSGDKEIKSNMKELDVIKPVVQEIEIGYPDPEAPADETSSEDAPAN
jgi:hypothetical protein